MNHPESNLLEADLNACTALASELAGESAMAAVIPDQQTAFANVATTCSSMSTSVSMGDAAGVSTGRATLEDAVAAVKVIFDAQAAMMHNGDSNGPTDTMSHP